MALAASAARSSRPPCKAATAWREVALDDDANSKAVAWWPDFTQNGGESLVMKPDRFVACDPKGLIQPASKVRGAEYLRFIYGLEYTLPGKLEHRGKRGLSGRRGLAQGRFGRQATILASRTSRD